MSENWGRVFPVLSLQIEQAKIRKSRSKVPTISLNTGIYVSEVIDFKLYTSDTSENIRTTSKKRKEEAIDPNFLLRAKNLSKLRARSCLTILIKPRANLDFNVLKL